VRVNDDQQSEEALSTENAEGAKFDSWGFQNTWLPSGHRFLCV